MDKNYYVLRLVNYTEENVPEFVGEVAITAEQNVDELPAYMVKEALKDFLKEYGCEGIGTVYFVGNMYEPDSDGDYIGDYTEAFKNIIEDKLEKDQLVNDVENLLNDDSENNEPLFIARDADTILADLIESCDFKLSGIAQDIFNIWKESSDKTSVERMFYEFTDMEFKDYLLKCKKESKSYPLNKPNIVTGVLVSVWNGGDFKIQSSCEVNLNTREIIKITGNKYDDNILEMLSHLEEEYIILEGEKRHIPVFEWSEFKKQNKIAFWY